MPEPPKNPYVMPLARAMLQAPVQPTGPDLPGHATVAVPPGALTDLTDPNRPYANEADYGFGTRYNAETPKGLGYFGNLQRPDGGIMGEYSLSPTINGRKVEIPSMVPTLTREELQSMLVLPDAAQPTAAIQQKALAFAKQRLAAGLPVFARQGEQQSLYPDLPRAPVPAATPQAPQGFGNDPAEVRALMLRNMPRTSTPQYRP